MLKADFEYQKGIFKNVIVQNNVKVFARKVLNENAP